MSWLNIFLYDLGLNRFFSPLIPIPASAAPAPVGPKKGVIRFIDPGNLGLKTFLSRTCATNIIVTQNQSEALIVECTPGGSSNMITLKVRVRKALGYHCPIPSRTLTRVGSTCLGWYGASQESPSFRQHLPSMSHIPFAIFRLTRVVTSFARPTGLSKLGSGPMTSSYAVGGTKHADVWDITSDGNIKMYWTNPSGGESASSLLKRSISERYYPCNQSKSPYTPDARITPPLTC